MLLSVANSLIALPIVKDNPTIACGWEQRLREHSLTPVNLAMHPSDTVSHNIDSPII